MAVIAIRADCVWVNRSEVTEFLTAEPTGNFGHEKCFYFS